jgi:hypothetical protein
MNLPRGNVSIRQFADGLEKYPIIDLEAVIKTVCGRDAAVELIAVH